jgi:hypothetical protein
MRAAWPSATFDTPIEDFIAAIGVARRNAYRQDAR